MKVRVGPVVGSVYGDNILVISTQVYNDHNNKRFTLVHYWIHLDSVPTTSYQCSLSVDPKFFKAEK